MDREDAGQQEKTDIRRSDLSGLKINSIIPAGYALAKCEDLGGLTKHEYCVRLSKGVKEVHLGRIDVDVEVDTNANFRL